MTRIAVFNQKGGVGKTSTVLNLAAAIHLRGSNPLMVDMDPQGHLTEIHENPNISASQSLFAFYQDSKPLQQLEVEWKNLGWLIPSHRELIKVDSIFGKGPAILNRMKQGLDTLEKESLQRPTLMDSCPYLGVLSLNSIFAADLVIIPIGSDFLSLQGAQKVESTLRALEPVLKKRLDRRYLLTCYDRRRKMTFEVHEQTKGLFGSEVLETVISENVAIAESPRYKKDVFQHNPHSAGSVDYKNLLDELVSKKLLNL